MPDATKLFCMILEQPSLVYRRNNHSQKALAKALVIIETRTPVREHFAMPIGGAAQTLTIRSPGPVTFEITAMNQKLPGILTGTQTWQERKAATTCLGSLIELFHHAHGRKIFITKTRARLRILDPMLKP
jgi:hypothetical protein